jgi:hypothetical protein
MPEHLDRSDLREEDIQNPGVAFEHTQADLRVVYMFLIMLAIGVALVFFVLWGFYAYMEKRQGSGVRPAPYTLSKPPEVPVPKLQPDPVSDNSRVQFTDQQWLNSYGWVDQKTGVARIPIDRAMDLLVQRGLPTSQTTNPKPAVGPYPGTARQQQDISRE